MLIKLLIGLFGLVLIWFLVSFFMNKNKNEEESNEKNVNDQDIESGSEEDLLTIEQQGLSHKTKNFILLSVIFILLLGGIITVHILLTKDYKVYEAKNKKLSSKLKKLQTQIASKEAVEVKLAKVKEEKMLSHNIIMQSDTPSQSLDYFLDINRRFGCNLTFNFKQGNSGQESSENVMFNTYVLNGEDYYANVLKFVSYIEREPAFYKVENINFQAQSPDERGKITYSLTLKAYHFAKGTPFEQIKYSDVFSRPVVYNPFFMRIHEALKPLDEEEFAKLLDSESAQLIAISNNIAYVKNTDSGKLLQMKVGEKVRYGKLAKIDKENHKIIFNIYRYGYLEKVEKFLEDSFTKDKE